MIVLGLQGRPAPSRPGWDGGATPRTWYHDAAAALLVDGEIVAAIEEERLTRVKHTGTFPVRAARACLDIAGIGLGDVDVVGFGEEGGPGRFRDAAIDAQAIADLLGSELDEPCTAAVHLVEHHIAHAMSAYAPAGFDSALIVTADGFGDGVSGYVIHADGWVLDVLDQIHVADSLGGFYSAALPLLGFHAHDEFKMMGLAPYGDPSVYADLYRASYRLLADGRFVIDRAGLADRLAQLGPPRRDGDFSERDRDVAAAAQAALEDVVLHLVGHWRAVTAADRLCLAGGVMHNSTLAGKLARLAPGVEVFVQPAAGDAGLALGAACVAGLTGGERAIAAMRTAALGPPLPTGDAARRELERWRAVVTVEHDDDVIAHSADLLAAGEVIGWVQGRSEWGPRALGQRSILADARPTANKDRVNALVKKRESFRPFAPVVRIEDADTYFDVPSGIDSAYMTFVVPVRPASRAVLGATTHVDGTARVQTVRRAVNEPLWNLLAAFAERTGVGVLLNTSFNNNCEPIVESIDDALACLLTTGLDALVVGDAVVRQRPGSAVVAELVPHVRQPVELVQTTSVGVSGATSYDCSLRSPLGATPITRPTHLVVSHAESDWTVAQRGAELVARGAATSVEIAAADDELFALWQQRLVTLLPPVSRPDG